jgi:hypothetical protein
MAPARAQRREVEGEAVRVWLLEERGKRRMVEKVGKYKQR